MSRKILDFISERKALWLKDRVKKSKNSEEESKLLQVADEKFGIASWITDASERARHLTLSSHLAKYSHPEAEASSVIALAEHESDGYLRTGNVAYELDCFGTAGAMDVYRFLMIMMEDGKTVLSHLEQDTDIIKQFVSDSGIDYELVKQGLMKMKQSSSQTKTHSLLKQVYFPVENDYHLLSILTSPGLLASLKEKVNQLRFSEEAKELRALRREGKYSEKNYEELWNLTVIAYGGANPQNISVLNAKNTGQFYVLASHPPEIIKRKVKLPTKDFFDNTLFRKNFKQDFSTLNRLIVLKRNNKAMRDAIKQSIETIAENVMWHVYQIREKYEAGWSSADHYQQLSDNQKIWLDNARESDRENQDEWFETVMKDFARWVVKTYEYLHEKEKIMLGTAEFEKIKDIIEEKINEDQEFFR